MGTKSKLNDPIEIHFDGRSVPRVNKTLLYVWNSGRKTGNGADIVPRDPLRVAVPNGAQVLRARVLRVTRDVNNVAVEQQSVHETSISFDFLDPGDGAVVEVLHTGEVKQRELKGTVKGVPDGPEKDSSASFEPRKISWAGLGAVSFGAAMVLVAALSGSGVPNQEERRVLEIIESLEEEEGELMIGYLEEFDALPTKQGTSAGFLYAFAGLIFLGGAIAIASAGSRHRPPRALIPDKAREQTKNSDSGGSEKDTA